MKTSVSLNRSNKSIKKASVKKSLGLSKYLNSLVIEFQEVHNELIKLKVTVYKRAWLIEQTYLSDIETDMNFKSLYPDFKKFMLRFVPGFDFLDYYTYKPLIVADKENVLKNITNSALSLLRLRTIRLATGKVHKNLDSILTLLPHNRLIEVDDIIKVFQDPDNKFIDIKTIDKLRVNLKNPYKKSDLAKANKEALIDFCLKLQSLLLKK